MRNRMTARVTGTGVLLLFALLAWLIPDLAGLAGARLWVLRGGLLVLGAAAGGLLYLYLAARARARAPGGAEEQDDLHLAFASASARLATARATASSRIEQLPLALVLGPAGATKTTLVTRSGLDPELLAGEVFRGETVIPTELVNLWLAGDTVFVEAGHRLLNDAAAWHRLAHHIRPSRVAAALGRGRQSPRVAIVCMGCDEFLRADAAEVLANTARTVRARLSELSQQLGIRLPVYVIFTRADRLPHFTDYVRTLTNEEAQQVLGATLPLTAATGGSWSDAQAARLQPAFDRIIRGLSLARLELLGRDTQEQARAAAYEFPRELRKLREPMVQFLIDVCRPSQLGINPFLRGFYFTGVRPVVVTDVALVERVTPSLDAAPAAGATSVFNPGQLQQARAERPLAGGGRRVPQWVFLPRLLPDVVLADEVARGMTAGGTRVELLRRGLIASAAAACVLFALGATVSFVGNRQLVKQGTIAAQQAREVGGTPGVVGEDDLARLDALHAVGARLRGYQQQGPPLRLTWGLYQGNAVHPLVRQVYFQRFGGALWRDTEERLLQYLRTLPDRPEESSDFGRTQDALAAHLLTTSEHTRATPDLLAPVLLSHARPPGSDSALHLTQRQFEYFAAELPFGNPYEDARADGALIERTQRFLRAFGREAYYRALISEANRAVPPVQFIGPAAVVRSNGAVPGAFTAQGWRFVQANLDSVEHFFARYQWIYGSEPPPDKPRREDLARLYVAEYIQRWQSYLSSGAVQRFSSPSDAAVKLGMLGAPTSPLFGLLALASRETALDSTSSVTLAFQSVHAAVPPDADPRAATAAALGYTNALNALATHMNLLASAGGGARDGALIQAAAAAAEVKREAATLAAGLAASGEAAVTASQVQRLLRQPAELAEALVGSLPAEELNAAGRSFCAAFAPVARRFPFGARSAADASVDEVHAIYLRDSGMLWSFYEDALQALLTPQGRARPGSRVRPEFARFFTRAAEFSNAAFRGAVLTLAFDFQPSIPAGASEVQLQVDGDRATFTPTSRASRAFIWEAERAREARLVVTYGGEAVTVASGTGPWAVFRLFHAGAWSGTGPYRVEWPVPGRGAALVAEVSFESGVPPVFRPGYLSPLGQCVAHITN
jgi:type VI secretion system protein ImpL